MLFFHSTTGEKIKKIKEYGSIFCAKSMKEKDGEDTQQVSYDDEYGYNTYVYGRPILHYDYGEFCLELDVPSWMVVANPLGNHIRWTSVLRPEEIKNFLMPGSLFAKLWEKENSSKLTLKELQEIYNGKYQDLVQAYPLLRQRRLTITELMVPGSIPLNFLIRTHVQH